MKIGVFGDSLKKSLRRAAFAVVMTTSVKPRRPIAMPPVNFH